MWRHTEGDNLLLLAAFLEFHRAVAIIAVNNKQSIRSNRRHMQVKVFKLGKRKIIIYLAIRTNL